MTIFFTVAIIILTVSNVLLWIVCKGLQIVLRKTLETNMELLKELAEEEE